MINIDKLDKLFRYADLLITAQATGFKTTKELTAVINEISKLLEIGTEWQN
jgi:hypothetical protein